ncbi:MAG: hypothetical protein ACD_45C00750G0001 [uncultured bacterium]|nr:MAG: hypothetical protein ACD_45C00750G0001 [uncultured bacterium]
MSIFPLDANPAVLVTLIVEVVVVTGALRVVTEKVGKLFVAVIVNVPLSIVAWVIAEFPVTPLQVMRAGVPLKLGIVKRRVPICNPDSAI